MIKKSVKDMDVYTIKRWAALIEGVQLISAEAKRKGIPDDQIEFKPNHLVSYIDERTEKIKLMK